MKLSNVDFNFVKDLWKTKEDNGVEWEEISENEGNFRVVVGDLLKTEAIRPAKVKRGIQHEDLGEDEGEKKRKRKRHDMT